MPTSRPSDGTSPARGACAVPQLAMLPAPCCCFLSLQPADPSPIACSVSQLRTCVGATPRGQGCSSWAAGRCPRRALSLGTVPQEGTCPTLLFLPPPPKCAVAGLEAARCLEQPCSLPTSQGEHLGLDFLRACGASLCLLVPNQQQECGAGGPARSARWCWGFAALYLGGKRSDCNVHGVCREPALMASLLRPAGAGLDAHVQSSLGRKGVMPLPGEGACAPRSVCARCFQRCSCKHDRVPAGQEASDLQAVTARVEVVCKGGGWGFCSLPNPPLFFFFLPMNFTRIFSPLSRAQVQLLNAPLSYAAQRSHALPPCLLGKATKRFPCTLPAVAVPRALCWAPWQAASWALVRGRCPAAPRGSLSWVGEEAEAERARKRAQGRAGMRPGSCELGWGGGGSGAGARRMLARGWPGQGLCHPSRTASGQRRWQPDVSQGLGHSLLGVTQSSLDLVSSGSLGKSRTSGQFQLRFPRQITDCPSHLAARPRLLLQPAPAPQSPAVPGHQPRGAVPAQPSAPCPLLGAWQRGRAAGPVPGAVPGFLQPFWREALRLQPFSPSCKYRAAEKRLGELNRAWDGVYENQVSAACWGFPQCPALVPLLPALPSPSLPFPWQMQD